MANTLLFGIQTNGIKHTRADPMPDIDTRFRMVKEAGIFDYVDKTPATEEIDQFLAARDKYDLPIRGSGWFYALGRDEGLLETNLQLGARLGSVVHNVQVLMHHADGHLVRDDEVVSFYRQAHEWGEKYGVTPCFEVHCQHVVRRLSAGGKGGPGGGRGRPSLLYDSRPQPCSLQDGQSSRARGLQHPAGGGIGRARPGPLQARQCVSALDRGRLDSPLSRARCRTEQSEKTPPRPTLRVNPGAGSNTPSSDPVPGNTTPHGMKKRSSPGRK